MSGQLYFGNNNFASDNMVRKPKLTNSKRPRKAGECVFLLLFGPIKVYWLLPAAATGSLSVDALFVLPALLV